MLVNTFQFMLEIRANDGRVLGQRPVEPNWEPAREWTRFTWWRQDHRSVAALGADTIVEPVAQPSTGLPFASGFRVTLTSDGQPIGRCDFPVTYFTTQARAVSGEMVAAGLLKEGEIFRYQLLAFPRERANGKQPAAAMFDVAEIVRAPPLKPTSFAALISAAAPFGELAAGDILVFIPQQILDEVSALTEEAGRIETGGVLVGHLCVDASIPDIGAQVTAQIPARHAQGDVSKLSFTGETWAAVEAALTLRRSDEIMLGWWHSHPARAWTECAVDCPPERRRTCALMKSFFSADDVCLHESVFAKAFHAALVVTNTFDGQQHALFGWRQGMVRQRGFYILNPDRPWQPVDATIQEGEPHATPCQ